MRTEDDQARAMLLAACADEVGGVVDDGEEVRVVGGLSGAAGGLGEVSAGGASRGLLLAQLSREGPRSSRGAEVVEEGPGRIHGGQLG